MIFLLQGDVSWVTEGVVKTKCSAPRYFDESIMLGLQRSHQATITALTTCVIWHFSLPSLVGAVSRGEADAMALWGFAQEAAHERRNMQATLQARLRNMKTYRRFRSEI